MNITEALVYYRSLKKAFETSKADLGAQINEEFQKRNSVPALMDLIEMLPKEFDTEPIRRKIRLLS